MESHELNAEFYVLGQKLQRAPVLVGGESTITLETEDTKTSYPCRSFVHKFIETLFYHMLGDRTYGPTANNLIVFPKSIGQTASSTGLAIGKETKAVDLRDTNLNKSLTGELVYYENILTKPVYTDGSYILMELKRSFFNNSDDTATSIGEVGLQMGYGDGTSYSNLVSRDLVPTDFQTLPPKQKLTVTYTLKMPYNAAGCITKGFWEELQKGMTGEITDCIWPFMKTGAEWPVSGLVLAPQDDDGFGIIVGSGATTFHPEDKTLAVKINQGSDPGDVVYGDMNKAGMTIQPRYQETYTRYEFVFQREVTNGSTETVNIREIGLFARGYGDPVVPVMLGRVVIDPIAVLPGQTVLVGTKFLIRNTQEGVVWHGRKRRSAQSPHREPRFTRSSPQQGWRRWRKRRRQVFR